MSGLLNGVIANLNLALYIKKLENMVLLFVSCTILGTRLCKSVHYDTFCFYFCFYWCEESKNEFVADSY